MNEFFKFLLNQDILYGLLREEWVKLYDYEYIDNKLISSLQANAEKVADMLNHVMFKAQGTVTTASTMGTNASTVKGKKLTTFEPFNLTQPKPKKIQTPIRIEHKKFITPIPYEQYQKLSLQKIEEARKERIESLKEVNYFSPRILPQNMKLIKALILRLKNAQ
jgi:hypothetical protein